MFSSAQQEARSAEVEKLQGRLQTYMEREKKSNLSHDAEMKKASEMNQRLQSQIALKEDYVKQREDAFNKEVSLFFLLSPIK